MASGERHKGWLQFVRKVVDVPLGYSTQDLHAFREIARQQYRSLLPLINDYIMLAEKSETDVAANPPKRKRAATDGSHRTSGQEVHLFDLMRDRRLFPTNADLSGLASRSLPNMRSYRFDKMPRHAIASTIIDHLEGLPVSTRERLETSMREALTAPPAKDSDRKSFLARWESIIKGIDL